MEQEVLEKPGLRVLVSLSFRSFMSLVVSL